MFPSPPAAYFQIAFSCLCTIIATPAHPRPGLLPLRSVLALTSPGRPLPHARHHLAPSPCVQCADHTPSGLPDFTLDFVTPQPAFQSGTVFFSILSAAPEGADWSTNTAASQGFARPAYKVAQSPPAPAHTTGVRGGRGTTLGVSPDQTPCPGHLWVPSTRQGAQRIDGQVEGRTGRWADGEWTRQ